MKRVFRSPAATWALILLCAVPVAAQRVERAVLAELFTQWVCGFCPNAEAALELLEDEYGGSALCVIAYHDYADPNPLATPETEARIDWYTDGPPFSGYSDVFPVVIIDGHTAVAGAIDVETAAANYRTVIDVDLEAGAPLSLELSGQIGETAGQVTIDVGVHDQLGAGPNVLRIVVIEREVESSGQSYLFVTRDILEDELLTVSAPGDTAGLTRGFAVDPGWDQTLLDVIAFVQDDGTLEVLQSARLVAQTPVEPATWGQIKALFR